MRKLMGNACQTEEIFNDVIAGVNVKKILQVSQAIIISFGMGYLPAASYANAAKELSKMD